MNLEQMKGLFLAGRLRHVTRILLSCFGAIIYGHRRMRLAEKYLKAYYRYKFLVEWRLAAEPPHWFDHRHDLFLWSEHRNAHWIERGIYSMEVLWPGCCVLDIGCGDGFYPYHFYTTSASHIDAIDIEAAAIAHASRYHNHPKIAYYVRDVVREEFPASRYDVVCWDGAIGHFSRKEIDVVMRKIKAVLGSSGVLSGYEEIEREDQRSWDHKIALESADNLRSLLGQYFPHVAILESYSPDRHNAYFRCSLDRARVGRFAEEKHADGDSSAIFRADR